MSCRKTRPQCKPRKKPKQHTPELQHCSSDLEKIGREQFFWHYPKSVLPIRDIRHKTEPHIEIGAENYLRACFQPSIRAFSHSSEQYLFLCTTCKNRKLQKGSFYGRRFIVGYIRKTHWLDMGNHVAVMGETYIVPFTKELEYGTLGLKRSRGMQKFSKHTTQKLVRRIRSHRNILQNCIQEMLRMESRERAAGKIIPIDTECLEDSCTLESQCPRRSGMKAMLLRVGIDKGTDNSLAPIFEDGSFEYIPISESDPHSKEQRTYQNTIGRSNKPLALYLPKGISQRKMHFDPEFESFTYGDPTAKRKYLLRLNSGDILAFYAGLTPWQNNKHPEALYIIGYFTVQRVIDFNQSSPGEIRQYYRQYPHNAHIKRSHNPLDLVIVVGDRSNSKLLDHAILISQKKPAKNGRPYHAVSEEMEHLLGISGSIQRSIPPRFIEGDPYLDNLRQILGM